MGAGAAFLFTDEVYIHVNEIEISSTVMQTPLPMKNPS